MDGFVRDNFIASVSIKNCTAVICLTGYFSLHGRRKFEAAYQHLLGNSKIEKIIVNFAGVEYIDSSALGMLLVLRNQAEAHKKPVLLSSPSSVVMKTFEIACFQKLFSIIDG